MRCASRAAHAEVDVWSSAKHVHTVWLEPVAAAVVASAATATATVAVASTSTSKICATSSSCSGIAMEVFFLGHHISTAAVRAVRAVRAIRAARVMVVVVSVVVQWRFLVKKNIAGVLVVVTMMAPVPMPVPVPVPMPLQEVAVRVLKRFSYFRHHCSVTHPHLATLLKLVRLYWAEFGRQFLQRKPRRSKLEPCFLPACDGLDAAFSIWVVDESVELSTCCFADCFGRCDERIDGCLWRGWRERSSE